MTTTKQKASGLQITVAEGAAGGYIARISEDEHGSVLSVGGLRTIAGAINGAVTSLDPRDVRDGITSVHYRGRDIGTVLSGWSWQRSERIERALTSTEVIS